MPRKHRRAQWASITEIEKGKRYRIRWWANGPDGYKRRSETVRGTRKDAELRRAELMLDHSEDAPCPTVGQAWERWYLPAAQRKVDGGDMAPSTLRAYRAAWDSVMAPRWGGVPLDSVRPLDVQQWLDGLTRTNASKAMRVLRPLGDYAVRYGVAPTNPFRERYLMPSQSTVNARDRGIWTLAELRGLWGRAWGQWWEAAFLLAAFAGLRTGETLGVLASEVGEAHGCAMVPVERQVSPSGLTDRLKTPQSRRVVPVPGIVGRRIVALAESSDGYLSGDGMGGPSARQTLFRAWSADHPFQNLRNSWQTWMRWEMRVPPWAIEVAMGHTSGGVTGQYYDRPVADVVAEVIADAYARRPYDDGWDELGRVDGVSAGQ